MKIKFKYIFFIIILVYSQTAMTILLDQIAEGDTLLSIAKRNHHLVLPRYTNFYEYLESIKNWNPKILNWDDLETGEYLHVDYPYDVPKHLIGNKVYTRSPYELYSDDIGEKKLSTFIALTSSFGNYQESIDDTKITSTQNFPITFGMSFSYKLEEGKRYFLSSFYYAYSSNAKIVTEEINKNAKIPGEFGSTFYYQYFFKNKLAIYGGIDIEKLNTFNTADVIHNNSEIIATQYNTLYSTIGLSKNFYLNQVPMGIKASYSKLLNSSEINSKRLKGNKYIILYSFRPIGIINFNIFYKHHNLKSDTSLKIDRIGMSFLLQCRIIF